jgi:hypothetical protein
LWQQHATSGRLTKANYDRVGGLEGLIEVAAERALAAHGLRRRQLRRAAAGATC